MQADRALQEGKAGEALEKGAAAAAADPSNVLALNLSGRAAARRFAEARSPEDAERARAAFEGALAVDPRFWPALQNLGELCEAEGKPADAARAYRRLLAQAPDHPERGRFEAFIARAERTARPARGRQGTSHEQ
jgi:tetratricopeptide (TPR) repeat protein